MKAFLASLVATAAQAYYYDKYENLLALNQRYSNGFSEIEITVDGKKQTKYLAADFMAGGGGQMTVPANHRGYLHNTPNMDKENPDYFKPNLLGGAVEWDMDMSDHECGCIASFYLVSMPGKDEAGKNWMTTDGFGYCDANRVDGNLCPEFDLMEANKYSWATTPHSCEAPNTGGFYYGCDANGHAAQNIYNILPWNGYGAGQDYIINTELPFHVRIDFETDTNNDFSAFKVQFTQNGAEQTMISESDYLHHMGQNLSDGMAFVLSQWGGDASWLWYDRCSGECNYPELSINNIKITSGKGKPSDPTEHIDPKKYEFGDICESSIDDYCGLMHCPGLAHCRWSWPKGDDMTWSSKHAACRCDVWDTVTYH